MTAPAPPRRRWFRFSLRTLFVLVTLLGVFSAWLTMQVKWITARHAALQLPNVYGDQKLYRTPPWGLVALGEPGYCYVWILAEKDASPEDERLRLHLETLFPEAEAYIGIRAEHPPLSQLKKQR